MMLYGEIIRQHLKLISDHVVADTIDYLEMKFSFQTDDWNGLEKWAHFARKNEVYDIRLTDDCIRKEDHLNLSAGIWKVYLHGNEFRDGEVVERITTCVENLQVAPTGSLSGEPFPEIPASETERILARLARLEEGGADGITPHIGSNGNWWIGETDTGVQAQGEPGEKGEPGKDGVSITSVKQTATSSADGGVNVVTVTLSDGQTATFEVKNGSAGSAGKDGVNGADGNGIKSVALNDDYTLTLTFTDGTSYTTPSIRGAAGAAGQDGQPGRDGKDGQPGADGFSPSVSVETIAGGHRITITDKTSTKTVDVMDGVDGDPGDPGEKGDPGSNGLAIYGYNGDMGVAPVAGGTVDAYSQSNIITLGSRTLQVGDLLVDLAGNVMRVTTVYSAEFEAGYVTNIHGEKGDPGATGAKGEKGDPGSDYVLTANDKTEIAGIVKNLFTSETWTFTLADGTTVEKAVALL